jgi:molecular chaperone DnaK (HSP70)
VALGAGVLASRLAGHDVQRVLVDVSPFSFGPSYLGERNGNFYPHCYHPLIKRNTPLPVTRTEEYMTASDFQTKVQLDIYQGDDPDAMRNVHIGQFRVEGLQPLAGPNSVLCRMRLDLDGILHVTAIEKQTGLSKHITISGASRKRNAGEIISSKEEIDRLFAGRVANRADEADQDATDSGLSAAGSSSAATAVISAEPSTGSAQALVERCRARMPSLHEDDREEAVNLIEAITSAQRDNNQAAVDESCKALREFLFFIEGK